MEDLPSMYLKYEDCRDEFGRRHGVISQLILIKFEIYNKLIIQAI